MNLYQLSSTTRQLQQMFDAEELDEQTYKDTMELLQSELLSQSVSVKQFLVQLDSNVEQVDAEIRRLKEIKTKIERTKDRTKEMILQVMETQQLKRIDTPIGNFTVKHYQSVEIESPKDLPSEYTTTVIDVKPDKVKIKKAIQSGIAVAGARIVSNPSLQGG